MDSAVFQGIRSCTCINFSTDNLKALSTPLHVLSSSLISGITTPCSLRNIEQNYSSVKNSIQLQSSKTFTYNYA